MSENLQVAVRVRPFNDREISMNSECCIRMIPATQQTVIIDPDSKAERSFTFDFSYNSFVNPSDEGFASQDTVWEDIGVKVLEHAWQGFNVSLFAYGQTGAGKSYSMVGYNQDRGIIPRASQVIFERIREAERKGSDVVFKVEASMMEIYNEKVKDLFSPSGENLKVRDHPKNGPYAEGLTSHAVGKYEEINTLMESGILARTTAATSMNATSSRAHTIFQIRLTQSEEDPMSKKIMDKVSRINLIDLAGSERASSTGATGGRLKEGAAINQSLSSLGNCISALADNAAGKKKLVPFRNSKLTHLLKDSLGGNAKTIMIAALSPASVNYGETMSTLKYADRAKQIKNQAVVNEDPNQKLIRELKEELLTLKRAMTAGSSMQMIPPGTPSSDTSVNEESDSREKELLSIREKLEENERLLAESQKSWQERLQETEQLAKKRQEQLDSIGLVTNSSATKERALKEPHILNLNEDQLMSEKLYYFLQQGANKVGREDATEQQDIVLGGLGILQQHCIMTYQKSESDATITIEVLNDAKIFLNGVKLESKKINVLNHCDRLVFGACNVFRLSIPILRNIADDSSWMTTESKFDWQYAMKELNSKQANLAMESISSVQRSEETEKERLEMEERLAEMNKRVELERIQAEEKVKQQKAEWENHVEKLKLEMLDKENQLKSQFSKDKSDSMQIANALANQEAKLAEELAKADIEYEQRKRAMLLKQTELENTLQKQMMETRKLAARKQREREERCILDEQLLNEIPLINEANSISEELKKNVGFVLKMNLTRPKLNVLGNTECDAIAIAESISSELRVQVSLLESNSKTLRTVIWDVDKFNYRLSVMKQMYQMYLENQRDLNVVQWGREEDPFCDTIDPQLIGRAYVYLQNANYGLPIRDKNPIYSLRGKPAGFLEVSLHFCILNEKWKPFVDESGNTTQHTMEHYMNQDISIQILVDSIENVPSKYCKNVFVAFQWMNNAEEYVSKPQEDTNVTHKIRFCTKITTKVTPELIEYCRVNPIEFEVYGNAPLGCATNQDAILETRSSSLSLPPIVEANTAKKKKKKKKTTIEELDRKVRDQAEEIKIQEKTLMENTQELESTLDEVKRLQSALHAESEVRRQRENQLESMQRQNEILREKIKQQMLSKQANSVREQANKVQVAPIKVHTSTSPKSKKTTNKKSTDIESSITEQVDIVKSKTSEPPRIKPITSLDQNVQSLKASQSNIVQSPGRKKTSKSPKKASNAANENLPIRESSISQKDNSNTNDNENSKKRAAMKKSNTEAMQRSKSVSMDKKNKPLGDTQAQTERQLHDTSGDVVVKTSQKDLSGKCILC